jgi:hypothetical protein
MDDTEKQIAEIRETAHRMLDHRCDLLAGVEYLISALSASEARRIHLECLFTQINGELERQGLFLAACTVDGQPELSEWIIFDKDDGDPVDCGIVDALIDALIEEN